MALTIIVNLCLSSTAQFPPPSLDTKPPSPPPLPSLPATMASPPLPALPTTMAPPSQPAPSPPITTIQPPPPIPSIPTTIIQPPPPILSIPTTIIQPPPAIPSVPTTIIPPLPPLPTIASPPSPPPTISSTSPAPLPTTAPSPPPTISSTSPAPLPTTAPTSPPNTTAPPPPPPTTTSPPPPPPPPPPEVSDPQDDQFNNIIDALMGAGDFGAWAGILSAADLSGFPLAATLFIPSNDAISHFPTATTATLNFDPFIIPYHIIPQRLSFSDLQRFKIHTRLPTLLHSKTILITNNSPFNFTINDSPITHPDLYATTTVSVHGIKIILDYSAYGGDGLFVPEEDPSMPMPTPPQATAPPFFQAGEIMGRRRSDAACLCSEFPIVLSVVCAALAFKIHRNPLSR
ncbi:uncharacterized protein LOC132280083 [Cornus florida]|uniref:uncharacterized protein LOC132280083 n=1 Tax=Cornus florida TaxID=4283 RepID=UPI00289B1E15|nr:uncharacterized protein LOC132280083 [Cornus florida]